MLHEINIHCLSSTACFFYKKIAWSMYYLVKLISIIPREHDWQLIFFNFRKVLFKEFTGCSLLDQHILSLINPKYNNFVRFTQIAVKFKTQVLQVLNFRTICANLRLYILDRLVTKHVYLKKNDLYHAVIMVLSCMKNPA